MGSMGSGFRPSRTLDPHPIQCSDTTVHSLNASARLAPSHAVQEDEIHLKVLRLVESRPDISQRELARELGISLGSVNYRLRALIQVGWIKARNFRNSRSKQAYLYKLTPEGIAAKAQATRCFLAKKEREYEQLADEIQRLRGELTGQSVRPERNADH